MSFGTLGGNLSHVQGYVGGINSSGNGGNQQFSNGGYGGSSMHQVGSKGYPIGPNFQHGPHFQSGNPPVGPNNNGNGYNISGGGGGAIPVL